MTDLRFQKEGNMRYTLPPPSFEVLTRHRIPDRRSLMYMSASRAVVLANHFAAATRTPKHGWSDLFDFTGVQSRSRLNSFPVRAKHIPIGTNQNNLILNGKRIFLNENNLILKARS